MVNVDTAISVAIWATGIGMTSVGIEMTVTPPTKSYQKWLYRSIFAVFGLVFIGANLWQSSRTQTEKQTEIAERHAEEVRNEGNIRYVEGQLDTMTKILHDLAMNSTPQQWMTALRDAMPKISPHQATPISPPPIVVPQGTFSDGQMFSIKKQIGTIAKGNLRLLCIGGKPNTEIMCDQIRNIFMGWGIQDITSGIMGSAGSVHVDGSYITGPDSGDKLLIKIFSIFDSAGAKIPLVPNAPMGRGGNAPAVVIVINQPD